MDVNDELKQNELIEIYKTTVLEEQFFLSDHHKRLAFYIGFISTLFVGTIAGIYKAQEAYEYLLIIVGPLAIWVLSFVGYKISKRAYKRFLETITVKAKIERKLNLDKKPINVDDQDTDWISTEQILNSRDIENQKKGNFKTSAEWVDNQMSRRGSVHANTKLLFIAISIFAIFPLYIAGNQFWIKNHNKNDVEIKSDDSILKKKPMTDTSTAKN